MPNAKDFIKQKDASFLLIGDTGAGKTTLIGEFPKPYIFDFDKGIAVLAGKDIEYVKFRDAPFKSTVIDPDEGIYAYGDAYPAFIRKLEEIGDLILAGKWEYKTLAFDSLTMLQDICMNWILKVAGRSNQQPQLQEWGALNDQFRKLFGQVTSWPGLKIVTAHIQRDTNDATKAIEMLPLLPPKLAAHIPVIFDEVYYLGVEFDSNKRRTYYMTTIKSPDKAAARSRWKVLDRCPPSFKRIIESAGFKLSDFE